MKRKQPAPKCEHEPYPLSPPRSPIERMMVITAYTCRKCGRSVDVARAAAEKRGGK